MVAAGREFFFDYDKTSSLIFQKTRDTANLPEFVEYVYCWLADDRLGGLILSGVTSDAGTHEQINQQESAFWSMPPRSPRRSPENIPTAPTPSSTFSTSTLTPNCPSLPPVRSPDLFTVYQRLVKTGADLEPTTSVETQYCGPALVYSGRKNHDAEITAPATHSHQSTRRFFANPDFFVVYDVKIERYVRTIESIHVFENVVYIARKLAGELGRQMNSQRSAQVQAQAQAEIEEWKESIKRAAEARSDRIRRLAEIL